jgi:hypothetical protein
MRCEECKQGKWQERGECEWEREREREKKIFVLNVENNWQSDS